MQPSPLISISPGSPSFKDDTSSVDLAVIAARVVEEFRHQGESFHEEWLQTEGYNEREGSSTVDDDDGEFEFSMLPGRSDLDCLVAADEIFHNGRIRPMYPYTLYHQEFRFCHDGGSEDNETGSTVKEPERIPRKRPPLRELMSHERHIASAAPTGASCSSSEADDDLDGVPPESYCLWKPGQVEREDDAVSSPSRWKIKSFSTGSSKRWRLRDLLYLRSSSDGKEAFLFLSSNRQTEKSTNTAGETKPEPSQAADDGGNKLYPKKNMPRSPTKDGEGVKRRSYLPYRQDLVGIFSNVPGLGRNLHPF